MEKTKKIFQFPILRRVFTFVKPYKGIFYSSLLLSVFLAIVTPIRPYLIQQTVDTAAGKNVPLPSWVTAIIGNNHSSLVQFIIAITLLQIGILLLETFMRFLFSFITAWLGQAVVRDMRNTVYKKVLGLNLKQFDNTPIGTLTTRTINDIESINDIFSDGLIPIISDILSIFFTLATMFWIDWQLALISLVPLPILLIATYYFKESVNKSFIKVRNAIAALNAFVQEHITGMQLVQAFGAEKRTFNKFKTINKEHRDANIKAIFAYSVFFPIVEVVLAVSMGLQVWWIAGNRLDAGLLLSFILYLNQIFRPLRVIADKFNVLQMGMIASERVFKVLDIEDSTTDSEAVMAAPSKQISGASIQFQQVYFQYTENVPVLKSISFEVKAGETVALVGKTGSGKTSIISILNRLYPIQSGTVNIDDVPIDAYSLQHLRESIGVVLQDVFLFSGSLADNITLRNPNISQAQIEETAKMIGVHNFIMQLPGGYNYHVMERGSTLSLGQRQIISFIRALLYNPKILILDEATSSVDTESEMLIQQAIDTLIKGRTSIVVAHRLSTIRKANKIIVLDKGEIVEMGSHEQLLQQKGYYASLHEMQLKTAVEV